MKTHSHRFQVGFIGLGKLGLPISEIMAKHHDVQGHDIRTVQSSSVEIVGTIDEVVRDKDLIFIAVPTSHLPHLDGTLPVGEERRDFNYDELKACLKEIARSVKPEQQVVIISTVLPGTTRRDLGEFMPIGQLIYNPYLIAMGTEQSDFLNPEMIILGSETGQDEDFIRLREFYKTMVRSTTRFVSGTWEEAESTKIFYNTFISTKLSIVNMIQDVAVKLGNMNVDVVTRALSESTYRIMSTAYMRAGMGDGGPCHPRDNIALRWLSEQLDLGYDLFDAVIESREGQARNLARFLLTKGSHIIILGKSFKPGVPYTAGSYSALIAHFIQEMGGRPEFFDPKTGDAEISPATKDTCYLISYWEDWVEDFSFCQGATVVDPWRSKRRLPNVRLVPYGNTRVSDSNVEMHL